MHRAAPFGGLALGLLAFVGPSRSLAAQTAAPRGEVLSAGGVPLGGAVVRIIQTGETARTDASGWFRWPGAGTGRWDLEVRAIGFQPAVFSIAVSNGALTPETVRLEPAVQLLDSITVRTVPTPTARLAGFERRRLTGLGRYFGEADIARTGALRVSSLLRMLPAGVRVQDSFGIPLAVSNRGPKLVEDGGQFYVVPCVLRTAVDGMIQPWGTTLDVVDPTEIVGIEVYLGASSLPAEFASGRRDQLCGLIAIWTR